MLTLIISSLIMVSEAGLTKNQKKTMKLFKKVRKLANNYNKEMVAMNTSLEEVEKGLEVTTRHLYNTDTFTLVDADFTGTQCGPFDLTSWSENYDIYLAAGSNGVSSDTTFNGGTWTSKENGWYHVCSGMKSELKNASLRQFTNLEDLT